MPGFDRKGPSGDGALSGRQGGMCKRTSDQQFGGSGRGQGRGMGMRCGSMDMAGQGRNVSQASASSFQTDAMDSDSELVMLKKQYQTALELLEELKNKIDIMETK